jgi:hypothetical protein
MHNQALGAAFRVQRSNLVEPSSDQCVKGSNSLTADNGLSHLMVYVFAIVAGLIGALGGGAIGFLAATATGVSSDGFVPFVVTIPTAAMGFIAAAALTIMFKGDVRSPREIAIRTAAVVLVTAVIAVGGLNLRTIAEFEIGLSSTTTPDDSVAIRYRVLERMS